MAGVPCSSYSIPSLYCFILQVFGFVFIQGRELSSISIVTFSWFYFVTAAAEDEDWLSLISFAHTNMVCCSWNSNIALICFTSFCFLWKLGKGGLNYLHFETKFCVCVGCNYWVVGWVGQERERGGGGG